MNRILKLNKSSKFAIEIFYDVLSSCVSFYCSVASADTNVISDADIAFLSSAYFNHRLVLCIYYVEHFLGAATQ